MDYKILIDKIAELNNGWKPDWTNHEQEKEYFVYCHGGYGLAIEQNNYHDTQCVSIDLYMDGNKSVADKVIKELGEDFIKNTLWKIKPTTEGRGE